LTPITWTNETRKLSELLPWEHNPRQLTEKQAKRLTNSIDEFGQVETLAIGPENEVYNGHQRLSVLLAQHGNDYEVAVRVSSRKLTFDEQRKLVIYLHEGATGEWNWDMVPNLYDVEELKDWGFPAWKLPGGDVNDPYAEWEGMPEFENEDISSFKRLVVHFADERAMNDFSQLIEQSVNSKTVFVWHPKQEQANLRALGYEHET